MPFESTDAFVLRKLREERTMLDNPTNRPLLTSCAICDQVHALFATHPVSDVTDDKRLVQDHTCCLSHKWDWQVSRLRQLGM